MLQTFVQLIHIVNVALQCINSVAYNRCSIWLGQIIIINKIAINNVKMGLAMIEFLKTAVCVFCIYFFKAQR